MKKIVLLSTLIGFCFYSAHADTKIHLNVKASIDPTLNIERIDNNGDIDIFQRQASYYRIVSNIYNNVEVHVETANNWKAKKNEPSETNDESNFISYKANFRGDNIDQDLDSTINHVEISKEYFKESVYEFSLLFYPEKSLKEKKYAPGNYSDTITVSVKAK
ncbi:MAG: hypothetical protein IJ730_04870 [Alphaproteobacteria bacterium]|nr:hypothetical protein [Alphaproteobacteria bacterium]